MRRFAFLLPVLLAGCAGQLAGSLGGISGSLGQLEQAKVAIVTAPLAGCVSEIQQAKMLLNMMETGTPAIPVSPNVPPIITAPPQTPASPAQPPSVVPAPSGASPIVTPSQTLRRRSAAHPSMANLGPQE
jgi:hypothetical protein